MRRLLGPFGLLLAAVLLLGGCTSWFGSEGSDEESPLVEPSEAVSPEPVAAEIAAESLLPAKDWHVQFQITDFGKAAVTVLEELVREPDRLVATYDGVPYVTWLLKEDGLWRQDPKGGETLLRFLPAQLRDQEHWVQESNGREVWFGLTRGAEFCRDLAGSRQQFVFEDCWTLTVLNRGEHLSLVFAPGLGPVHADVKNWARQADSFVKQMELDRPGALSAEHRQESVANAPVPSGEKAAIRTVTKEAFERAARAMELNAQ